MPAGAQWSLAI